MSDKDLIKEPSQVTENKLMSDQFDAFYADLELLYIVGNASGRIKFAQAWPAAAAFIFGDELIDYDQNGVQNRERLLELEEDAEIRRGVLLETFETIEQQSADKGSLRTDFVGSVVRECATCQRWAAALVVAHPTSFVLCLIRYECTVL